MRRNLDTVRNILEAIEQRDECYFQASSLDIPDCSYEEVCYHLDLLLDVELISAEVIRTYPFETWVIERLTWDGHEYLDMYRSVATDLGETGDGGGDYA